MLVLFTKVTTLYDTSYLKRLFCQLNRIYCIQIYGLFWFEERIKIQVFHGTITS